MMALNMLLFDVKISKICGFCPRLSQGHFKDISMAAYQEYRLTDVRETVLKHA